MWPQQTINPSAKGAGLRCSSESRNLFHLSSQMEVVELRCAGGMTLATTKKTLSRAPFSRLNSDSKATEESQAHLVALLLDALRRENMKLIVPDGFDQWSEFVIFCKIGLFIFHGLPIAVEFRFLILHEYILLTN